MIKGTIVRDDSVWQGHPDVALFKNDIVIAYRESSRHMTHGPTKIKIVVKRSSNFFDTPIEVASSKWRLNCPRLSVVNDKLYLICDQVEKSTSYIQAENDESKTRVLLWVTDDLINWTGPIDTGITGIVPDKICITNDGFCIATHTCVKDHLVQNIWHATSMDGPWTKYPLCYLDSHNICEASVFKVNNKYAALLRENSGLGLPAFVCYSDNSTEWSKPYKTRLYGCHRPVCGMLKSGNLLTTYREATHSFSKGFWAKNTFACLTKSNRVPIDFSYSIILPLDHDQSQYADSGYTGWIQLPDSSIFVVNYITADAPRPYLRWYTFTEKDF